MNSHETDDEKPRTRILHAEDIFSGRSRAESSTPVPLNKQFYLPALRVTTTKSTTKGH